MTALTLTPAYGRDYKSKKAVMEAFLSGKDFVVQPRGCYANLWNLSVGDQITIRYKQLRQVTVFAITKEMKDAPSA